MTTITLDEITRNAVLAALDERAARLEVVLAPLLARQAERDRHGWGPLPEEDAQRALVWNIAALHETKQAREIIGSAEAWNESEMAAAFGR